MRYMRNITPNDSPHIFYDSLKDGRDILAVTSVDNSSLINYQLDPQ